MQGNGKTKLKKELENIVRNFKCVPMLLPMFSVFNIISSC